MLKKEDIVRMVDISAVKTNISVSEIHGMVNYAIDNNLICVFGMPCYLPLISKLLKNYDNILVGGVVGFPSGADPTEWKVTQTKWSIENGANEIDMVINVGFLKSKMNDEVLEDIKGVVQAADGHFVKVILEVGYLTDEEIVRGTELSIQAGAKFLKTGTGWSNIPTDLHHIELIRNTAKGRTKIKAAGGVNSLELLEAMYKNGVTRFGLGRNSIEQIFSQLK